LVGHGCESGRLDLPFVGISNFGKRPYSAITADAAILGAQSLCNTLGSVFHAGTGGGASRLPAMDPGFIGLKR